MSDEPLIADNRDRAICELHRELGQMARENEQLRKRIQLLEQDKAALLAVRILMRGVLTQLDEGSE